MRAGRGDGPRALRMRRDIVALSGRRFGGVRRSNHPPRAAHAQPTFNASGPDADDYGRTAAGFPRADQSNWYSLPYLVDSHSRLDEIFPARTVARPAAPSLLRRAATEPAITYRFQGETRTLDDYVGRHPVTGCSLPVAIPSSSSATSTPAAIPIASPRGRWPRRSPPSSWASPLTRGTSAPSTTVRTPTSPSWPASSTGALRSDICSPCPRGSNSSRTTAVATMSHSSSRTRSWARARAGRPR
jgi:hypothetical protein